MEEHLKKTKRNPEDKALTKTMINNYAKNRLLPAPVRKKYNKEHILLLLFIYYYKSLLSISDIEQLFRPVTEQHFNTADSLTLSDIYEEVFSREALQMEHLKDDIRQSLRTAARPSLISKGKIRNTCSCFPLSASFPSMST